MRRAWGRVGAASRRRSTRCPICPTCRSSSARPGPGQAPQIVENQVTYPLTTTMLSVPGAKTVRGYSFFGDSFVYVLFEDGTDLYWARSRVLEYLNQVQSRLPRDSAKTSLGPDATGVGWIYEYALVDRTGKHDLAQLRALQDWFLKYELKTVPNVSEVATVGGMVQQYQIVLDPDRLRAYGITQAQVIEAVQQGEPGSRRLGAGTGRGRIHGARVAAISRSLDDFRDDPVDDRREAACRCGWATWRAVQLGPEMRRGIAELERRGRSRGRHHRDALGQERAGRPSTRSRPNWTTLQGEPAGRRGDRHDLRPLAADQARDRQPARQADRRIPRRRAGLRAVPVPPALRPRGHRLVAARRAGGVHRHALPGHQRQHHVAGRHRHRDRRHGRCRDRDDRERAQASRSAGSTPIRTETRRATNTGG